MRRQRGVALLMALWALALVAALLPVLLAEGRAELQRARLLEHEILARALAAGAEQVVTQGLVQAGARQRPEFWRSLSGEVLAYEVEGAQVRAQLRDLHGCFNVNALAGPERDLALRQLKRLLAQRPGGLGEPGLTAEGFAERLADWVDADGETREFGLETPDALRLAPPVLVPNLPLAEIGELDLIVPARPGRHLHLRELCALPETSGWRLNANALGMSHLPLLVVLADVGSGPGLWLAERLEEADLLLCARGQDLWPELIPVMRGSGRPLPVCLPGCRGVGIFEIRCRGGRDGWRLDAVFHPVQAERVLDRALLESHQRQLAVARAPHAGWLDQRLARAPVDLWRRDLLGGSWDALIAAALGGGDAQPVLLPGLRYDQPLRRGDWITREHLIALCGGHEATVLDLPTSADGLRTLLEEAADNRFGEPLLLDNSQDLPRLTGVQWTCRYGAPRGQRIGPVQAPLGTSFTCRTFALGRELGAGEALWQRLEAFLRARPADWGLAPLPVPRLEFVEGHPGWHPLAALRRRLESLA